MTRRSLYPHDALSPRARLEGLRKHVVERPTKTASRWTCVVELETPVFDEENNIEWSRPLDAREAAYVIVTVWYKREGSIT